MRLPRDKDRHTLPAVRLGQSQADFHAQLGGQFLQAGAQAARIQMTRPPGRLYRHAELAPGHLLFEPLDIGRRFKEKTGDSGNDPGLVPADYSDGGVMIHNGR